MFYIDSNPLPTVKFFKNDAHFLMDNIDLKSINESH